MISPTPVVRLDRSVDVPLHRQIAAQLRFRIASGDLRTGNPLPSLRTAADHWGVNLHTVRRAYEILETEGLLVTNPRARARVAVNAHALLAGADGFDAFLRNVRETAERRFGASVDDVIDRLRILDLTRTTDSGPVWVVECSPSLAAGLARQVRARWSVDARPWTLDAIDHLPTGQVVATLYHMREIRAAGRMAGRDVHFVQVRVDAGPIEHLRRTLSKTAPRLVLCGVDCESALAIGSEVRDALGGSLEIDLEVGDDPVKVLRSAGRNVPVLFSPQSWDRLDEKARRDPRTLPYRTLIPPDELEGLGVAMGWTDP